MFIDVNFWSGDNLAISLTIFTNYKRQTAVYKSKFTTETSFRDNDAMEIIKL